MNRAAFLRLLAGATVGAASAAIAFPRKGFAAEAAPAAAPTAARAAGAADFDFWFTRLMYDSGDWDVDQRMPANLITSLIEYTQLRVDPTERVLALADPRMLQAPFCYLAGHKLVEFNPDERRNFEHYVRNGGFVFVDDCNHDIDGRLGVLYSNKDYGCDWDYDWRNKRWLAEDNTKFGVNIVVYALTA